MIYSEHLSLFAGKAGWGGIGRYFVPGLNRVPSSGWLTYLAYKRFPQLLASLVRLFRYIPGGCTHRFRANECVHVVDHCMQQSVECSCQRWRVFSFSVKTIQAICLCCELVTGLQAHAGVSLCARSRVCCCVVVLV